LHYSERKVECEDPEEKSSTELYQTHKACSFGLKTVCHYDDQYSVLKESIRCREMVNKIFKKKMVMTEITWKLPVVFHNLRGYDSHLIMQEIGKFKMNINVVPNNMEKYISFSGTYDISKLNATELPTDVFENFRKTCLENYKLDPAHYISAPSLSWDAFLKQSDDYLGDAGRGMLQRLKIGGVLSSENDLLKLTASPCFQSHRIMNESLIVVKRLKEVLTLNKPCYVGMSILDLSKTLILMYEIKTDDVYEDFKRIAHNKKVIGKFKDEAEGVPVTEFVGLRSKMYSYVKESGGGGMTAKGVKKPIQRLIPFEILETSRNDRRDDNSEGQLNETIVELPEIENSDENRKQRNDGRVRRKAAIEGQNLRRAREQYY
ncbi:Hypothetical predicted protein, partial [Paramuricea clavata]